MKLGLLVDTLAAWAPLASFARTWMDGWADGIFAAASADQENAKSRHRRHAVAISRPKRDTPRGLPE